MPSEIVLNGTKLWEGTELAKQPSRYSNEGDVLTLTFPGGGTRMLMAADELVIDGEVIIGPHAGMKLETRQVGSDGRLLRDVYYKGEHGDRCEKTQDGWVCRYPCTVVDVPSTPTHQVTLDALIEVVSEIERRWLMTRYWRLPWPMLPRVWWTLSRHSHSIHFTNGRAHLPAHETISREVWHRGRTWTKWGARREMRKHGWAG